MRINFRVMKERIKSKKYNSQAHKLCVSGHGSMEKAAEAYGMSTRQLYRTLSTPSKDEEKKKMMCEKTPGLSLKIIHRC